MVSKHFKNFIYFSFGCTGFSLLCGLFSSYSSRATLQSWCVGFSLQWLHLLQRTGPRVSQSSSYCACALEHRLNSHITWGLVSPQHVGSSRTRAQTHFSCIGKWIPHHCTTREVLNRQIKKKIPFCLFLLLFPIFWEVGHRGSCCDLCRRGFCLCSPLGVL